MTKSRRHPAIKTSHWTTHTRTPDYTNIHSRCLLQGRGLQPKSFDGLHNLMLIIHPRPVVRARTDPIGRPLSAMSSEPIVSTVTPGYLVLHCALDSSPPGGNSLTHSDSFNISHSSPMTSNDFKVTDHPYDLVPPVKPNKLHFSRLFVRYMGVIDSPSGVKSKTVNGRKGRWIVSVRDDQL